MVFSIFNRKKDSFHLKHPNERNRVKPFKTSTEETVIQTTLDSKKSQSYGCSLYWNEEKMPIEMYKLHPLAVLSYFNRKVFRTLNAIQLLIRNEFPRLSL